HRTDQAFTSDPLACAPIYITKFVPRKVCLKLFSGAMIEVHHRLFSFQMSSQVLAKLRVAVTVRVIVAIFLPKQLTSDSAAAEFSFVVIKSPFNRSIPIIDYSTSTILLNGICLNDSRQCFILELKQFVQRSIPLSHSSQIIANCIAAYAGEPFDVSDAATLKV